MSSNELRKNVWNRREILFQGVAGSAPAGAAVATMTGAAQYSLSALPLAALITFFIVLLNAYIITRVSKRVAGSAGHYDYSKHAFGAVAGRLPHNERIERIHNYRDNFRLGHNRKDFVNKNSNTDHHG